MVKKLFIGCMPFRFTVEDLHRELASYGNILALELYQDLQQATFDSYAHVEIDTDNLEQLLAELDGKHMGNRVLRVNERLSRPDDLNLL